MNANQQILFVAWQSPVTRAICPVARLVFRNDSPQYEFVYVNGVREAQGDGFEPFFRMKNLDRIYRFDELPPLFTNRLMPQLRPDYREYLERLGLQGDPEPMVILARSEGRKATDTLEIWGAPDFDDSKGEWVYYGFARGVRHIEGAEEAIHALRPGDELLIERDRGNARDARALLLRADRAHIGYVPHTLLDDLDHLLSAGSSVMPQVVQVNGPPAPVHQRLLVAFRAKHRTGFQPLSSRRYDPIVSEATAVRFVPQPAVS